MKKGQHRCRTAPPETHVIDYRAAEQLLAARDPHGAVKLLDEVVAVYPENTAARLLRARAFFLAAQLRPAELEFQLVLGGGAPRGQVPDGRRDLGPRAPGR